MMDVRELTGTDRIEETPGCLLFAPLRLRSVTLRNRIMASPMCQYASDDGMPQDWHLAHLGRLAIGGSALVFHEETAVEARGRKTHHCAGLWRDDQIPAFARIADLIRQCGAVPAIQLGHAGAKASAHGAMRDWAKLRPEDAADGLPPWPAISPSGIATSRDGPDPDALDATGIESVICAWGAAAARAARAGFEVLEIHSAHGYLIQQFLSEVTNRRTDDWGGTRENRMRFALAVTHEVRRNWPAHLPLFFRVSAVDGKGGLWDLDDTVALAAELRTLGVDMVDCSSGGLSGTSAMPIVPRVPGYHLPFARAVRERAGIATVGVGLIREPAQAEAALRDGSADIVALARELMYHADWPVHAAQALGEPDPFALFPEPFAFRLRRREEVADYACNKPADALPSDVVSKIEST
ncbi:NADH:flavin oxidoreductase/NADH oxidase [Roseovarius sp. A46]|uniref:NADH:flavin oxidoreductase/NADH oxidase n=1 Tax=Roseovarius sp. A46 TaxID=2109331 RepID=UPI0019D6C85A|nr:NADH:flavin oxidoreductase/NADH oxidase [Roseovarius sp. A46]